MVFVEMLQPCGLHFPEGIGAGVQQFVHGDGFCPRCISDYSRGQAQAKEDRGVADVEEPRVGMFGCDVVGENACLVVGHSVQRAAKPHEGAHGLTQTQWCVIGDLEDGRQAAAAGVPGQAAAAEACGTATTTSPFERR